MLSLGRLKGSRHYWSIALLLGWPLLPRGNSALPVSKSSSAISLKTPYSTAPKKVLGVIISNILPNRWVLSNAPTRACIQRLTSNWVSLDPFSRTRFQRFLSNPPRSSFKKLIILTLRLIQGLRTMSLAKAVPDGIKDKECKRFALWERHPVPYVPEKDPVQETISTLKSDQSLKTTIGEDAELCIPTSTLARARLFSCMWVQPSMQSRNRAPSRPTRKLLRLMCRAPWGSEASKGCSSPSNNSR